MTYHPHVLIYGNDPTYKRINQDGYVMVKRTEHPRANKRSYELFEHIEVYEKTNNCCLLVWGNVHHIDGDKQNNDWINLRGMIKGAHMSMENLKDLNDRRCIKCGSSKTSMRTEVRCGKRPHWFKTRDGNFQCDTCYHRELRERRSMR